MAKCKVITPHNIIDFRGEKFVEVEWPEDGRYDIGYQLAQETDRGGRRYMGLFESAARRLGVFRSIHRKEGAHYNIFSVGRGREREEDGMEALRQIFPEGEANELNFCLFSTGGVHGLYNSIEEAEKHLTNPSEDTCGSVTFLMVHPRIVCLRYGNCRPQNAEDIAYLKKLRETSWRAVQEIGK